MTGRSAKRRALDYGRSGIIMTGFPEPSPFRQEPPAMSLFSRRSFLGVAAGAAGAALLGPSRFVSCQESSEFPGFLIGIQSYSLRGFPVDQAIQHAADLGFAHMEFFGDHFPLNSTPEQITAMQEKMASHNLKIAGHGVNGFGGDHEANRAIFEFAKQAGIKNISADPSPEAFDSLDKLVAEYDIRIAIHNHGPSARYDRVVDVLKAIEGHDPRIGACADLGHYIRSGEDPVEVIRVLKGRLYGIHLKDFAEQKAETKGVILGQGHLNVEAVFRALKDVNFPIDGCLSLEYEENPSDPIADIRECLAIAKEAAQRALAS
jgi:inosose dehydratase